MTQTLLVELLTEELPPKALAKLGDAFAAAIFNGLKARDFLADGATLTSYATPRRLAVAISQVRATSLDKTVREKVLPVTVALDAEGRPSAPLVKKLAALAAQTGATVITPDQLERAQDGKAESFFYTYTAKGSTLQSGLQTALEEAVAKLPIPKLMSYQRQFGRAAGETVHFVRPAHRLLALHGNDVVPLNILGLDAGNQTLGHRFLSQGAITIANPDSYSATLETEGKLIPSFIARKEKIRTDLLAKAGDDKVLMPESLLDEVTALVEWPVVYECKFDDQFLAVPQECLILTMQTNQKYFALTDAAGKLRSRFLIVSNLATDFPQHIIQGNERVVRPRLSDAKFFFEQDKKKSLADRIPQLANVVYHNKLGNQLQRTERVQALAAAIAALLGGDSTAVALAERGALLAKADLLTDMVGEFPELQGIMGTYYARHDGEPDAVALAASEHYQPRFAGDALPSSLTGTAVALADKLETLVGIWGIGLQPTGDKDPFALRRHALGILRMLVEKRLPLSIPVLIQQAVALFAGNPQFKDPSAEVSSFIYDRLRGLLRERNYTPNEIEAVIAQQPAQLDNITERLDAVQAFAALPEAEALAAANKRITNILKKIETDVSGTVDSALLQEAAEKALYAAMLKLKPQVDTAFAAGNFSDALMALAQLRQDVDAFFTDVMVNAEDAQLRNNRQALLAQLHQMLNQVADISKLAA
ncbi:glycyl-tRNA synthetase beta chain [Herbaspirillum sp. Sphag1AN]|uniref:glycine--tRNA ligase subunit beta n=1 Tax=unclassified Herbaspirillum TaxID=2624150 RepID=UPI00161EF074|nr:MULTISPECIES: glycine--tRNA ligase subunit beta [unclassified Herbaspirillum]MBB3214245.1 glycyl-tRNA synthetase beta chain [Herbaspirillum sp. Sphag1AN]MBB3247203.1 glycyl-tRNA synthetase beta chain [Herbaspirillum sp. Sphag64]